jgi:arylsulfatase A-like enzyme
MDGVETADRRRAIMEPKIENFHVPLMRNTEVIERPADQNTITKRYTEEALKFISENKKKPFFLYLAHSFPHVPLFASEDFREKSERGLYGDVIAEIDWSVGQILTALRKEGLDKKTWVIFTSDNGPWALYDDHGGSAGLLYGAKGASYEGGVRVPAIFWAPGRIKPAVISRMGSTLDLLPTICKIANVPMQRDRKYDGYDLSPVLEGTGADPRKEMIFYHGTKIFAARKGDFKMYFYRNNPMGYPEKMEKLDTFTLFNVQQDPSEKFDIANENPLIMEDIRALVRQHIATIDSVGSQLEKKIVQR